MWIKKVLLKRYFYLWGENANCFVLFKRGYFLFVIIRCKIILEIRILLFLRYSTDRKYHLCQRPFVAEKSQMCCSPFIPSKKSLKAVFYDALALLLFDWWHLMCVFYDNVKCSRFCRITHRSSAINILSLILSANILAWKRVKKNNKIKKLNFKLRKPDSIYLAIWVVCQKKSVSKNQKTSNSYAGLNFQVNNKI